MNALLMKSGEALVDVTVPDPDPYTKASHVTVARTNSDGVGHSFAVMLNPEQLDELGQFLRDRSAEITRKNAIRDEAKRYAV